LKELKKQGRDFMGENTEELVVSLENSLSSDICDTVGDLAEVSKIPFIFQSSPLVRPLSLFFPHCPTPKMPADIIRVGK